MMVELIPKSFEEIPSWQRILFYSLAFLAVGMLVVYLILGNFYGKSEGYKESLQQSLVEARTDEILNMEQEVEYYKEKIDNYYPLLQKHLFDTKFFELLEKKTLPKTYFREIVLDSKDAKVSLSGTTESFSYLGQQLAILREDPMLNKFTLSEVAIAKEGGVDFRIDVLLSKELFKY